jgi:hypothetical protein
LAATHYVDHSVDFKIFVLNLAHHCVCLHGTAFQNNSAHLISSECRILSNMDKDDRRQQRQSSLPNSLLPYLFSGPQQPRYSQTRTTLQSEDPPFPHDREPSTQINPLQTASFSFDHHPRQFPPPDSTPTDARDRQQDRRLPYLSSTLPHRVLDPPSSFLQPYGGPIYSDPVFHSATHPSMPPSRSQTYSLPPSNRHSFQPLDTWREGEPGPSSLMRPVSHDEAAFSRLRRGSNQSPLRVDPRSSGAYRSGSPGFELGPSVEEHFRHRGERDTYRSSSDHSWPGGFTLTLQRLSYLLSHRRLSSISIS